MSEQQPEDNDIDLDAVMAFVLRRRWIILVVWAIAFSGAALLTYTARPVYEASAMLLIEKERGAGAVNSNGSMVENKNDDYYQTQYKLLQSMSLTQKVYDALGLQSVPDFAQPHGVEKLQNAVAILPVPRSRLLYVRATSFDPKLAAKIANSISETFVNENVSNQLFISKEILQTLQISQNSPGAKQLYETLPNVVNNQMVQGLKADYAKLESQFAEMSQRLTPKHPSMMALRSNMATLKSQIQNETEKVVQSLKTELSGQLKGNNVRIVDPALVPDSPSKPNKRRGLLVGLLGGLVAGLIVGYGIEFLDQTIRTQDDVETKLHLPFLGTIPEHGKVQDVVYQALTSPEPSLTGESFRNLRTMVDFAGVTDQAKQILVTSSVQAEGKSYVSTNLAVAYAQNGESVLLIDGDLRRPKQHKNLHLSSQHGLSDFLAKGTKVEDVSELLQDSKVPNLKVLVCGTRPPNPSELLNTPRLPALITWAKANFDRVVVDCTPTFPINDTLLWGRHIKSVVFVCRYGQTRIPILRGAREKLKSANINILGMAINSAKQGGLTYAYQAHYYQQYYQEYSQKTEAGKSA